MPDNNSEFDKQGSGVRSKLADLESQFNTAKGFGFQGLMADQAAREREANQPAPQPTTPAPEPKREDEVPSWVAPVQTSIHTIKQEFQQGLGALKAEIDQLRPQQQENVDPNLPPEVAPVYQRVDRITRDFQTLALKQEEQRAREALRDARSKYKEFSFSDEDFRNTWGHVAKSLNNAAAFQWDNYFRTQYEAQVNPRLASENEKLRAEVERLRSGGGRNQVEDLTGVPRANRQSVAASQLAETSRDGDFDEELYQRAKSKVSKGIFRGFGRALADEQSKMRRIQTA